MSSTITFGAVDNKEDVSHLKKEWLETLVSPQDGMWESFRENATHWAIRDESQLIGYACVEDSRRLIQFYLQPSHFSGGVAIFQNFVQTANVQNAMVGTNNPLFLSFALEIASDVTVDSYLFRERFDAEVAPKDGELVLCPPEELQHLIDFYHYSIGATKEWLSGYLGERVSNQEAYYYKNNGEIIATCEVRNSPSNPLIADIGMAVSPDFRRQGYGSFMLHQAALKALEFGKKPICSCEKTNVGSFKSISKSGFLSTFQLLAVNFQ